MGHKGSETSTAGTSAAEKKEMSKFCISGMPGESD